MALGHLAPYIVSPNELWTILKKVEHEILEALSLPHDPNDICDNYQTTVGPTLIHRSKLITVSMIPLVNQDNRYTMYQLHNIPMPKGGLVARYVVKAEALVINVQGTQYMLLSREDLLWCSAQMCQIYT
jgi:hypothetical protein